MQNEIRYAINFKECRNGKGYYFENIKSEKVQSGLRQVNLKLLYQYF